MKSQVGGKESVGPGLWAYKLSTPLITLCAVRDKPPFCVILLAQNIAHYKLIAVKKLAAEISKHWLLRRLLKNSYNFVEKDSIVELK